MIAAVVPLPGTHVEFVVVGYGKYALAIPRSKKGASGRAFVVSGRTLGGRSPIPWLAEHGIQFERVRDAWATLEAHEVTLEEALTKLTTVPGHGPVVGWEPGESEWAAVPGMARLISEACYLPDWLAPLIDSAGEFQRVQGLDMRPIIDWDWVLAELDPHGRAEAKGGVWTATSSAIRLELGLPEGYRIACLMAGKYPMPARNARDPRAPRSEPAQAAEPPIREDLKLKHRAEHPRLSDPQVQVLQKGEKGGRPVKGSAPPSATESSPPVRTTPVIKARTRLRAVDVGDRLSVLGWPEDMSYENREAVMLLAADEEHNLAMDGVTADLNQLLDKYLGIHERAEQAARQAAEAAEKAASKAARAAEHKKKAAPTPVTPEAAEAARVAAAELKAKQDAAEAEKLAAAEAKAAKQRAEHAAKKATEAAEKAEAEAKAKLAAEEAASAAKLKAEQKAAEEVAKAEAKKLASAKKEELDKLFLAAELLGEAAALSFLEKIETGADPAEAFVATEAKFAKKRKPSKKDKKVEGEVLPETEMKVA